MNVWSKTLIWAAIGTRFNLGIDCTVYWWSLYPSISLVLLWNIGMVKLKSSEKVSFVNFAILRPIKICYLYKKIFSFTETLPIYLLGCECVKSPAWEFYDILNCCFLLSSTEGKTTELSLLVGHYIQYLHLYDSVAPPVFMILCQILAATCYIM